MNKKELLKWVERYVGRTGVRAVRWARGHEKCDLMAAPRKVLVICLAAMGDAINLLPALRYLREALPESRIDVLTSPRAVPVFEGVPLIDEILDVDIYGSLVQAPQRLVSLVRTLRSRRYEVVVDTEQYSALTGLVTTLSGAPVRIGFSTEGKQVDQAYSHLVRYMPARHEAHCFVDLLEPLLGPQPYPASLEPVAVRPEDRLRAQSLLKELGYDGGLLVGIHALSGSTAVSRRWPAERFCQVARLVISQFGAQVLLTGSEEERKTLEDLARVIGEGALVAAGRTSVREFAALIECCSLYIGNDSGPMHLAAAMGVKVIGLFGPNTPVKWGPLGNGNVALSAGLPCSPCIDVSKGFFRECANPACMTSLEVVQVFEAVRGLLK